MAWGGARDTGTHCADPSTASLRVRARSLIDVGNRCVNGMFAVFLRSGTKLWRDDISDDDVAMTTSVMRHTIVSPSRRLWPVSRSSRFIDCGFAYGLRVYLIAGLLPDMLSVNVWVQ